MGFSGDQYRTCDISQISTILTTDLPLGMILRMTTKTDLAYDRMEAMLVSGELAPGRFLAMHELQTMLSMGRTPVHQAVTRLAGDTLILIKPRHGLQITPIDLKRERLLLSLRRDVERFVIRLATECASPAQRTEMTQLHTQLCAAKDMNLAQFNATDRRIDQLFLEAANEPFVAATLRPLHTLFRRIGWLYHAQNTQTTALQTSIDGHIAVLDAVASQHVERAVQATDALMDFVDEMFDALEGVVRG
jgi:DNA-binding GntR family transcriptional regulator